MYTKGWTSITKNRNVLFRDSCSERKVEAWNREWIVSGSEMWVFISLCFPINGVLMGVDAFDRPLFTVYFVFESRCHFRVRNVVFSGPFRQPHPSRLAALLSFAATPSSFAYLADRCCFRAGRRRPLRI